MPPTSTIDKPTVTNKPTDKNRVDDPNDPRKNPNFSGDLVLRDDPSLVAKLPHEEIPFAGDNSGNYFENHPGGNPPPIVEPDMTKIPASNPEDKDYDQNLDPLRDANNLRKRLKKDYSGIPHPPNQAINFPSQVNTVPGGSVMTREEIDKKESVDKDAAVTAANNAIETIKSGKDKLPAQEVNPSGKVEGSKVTTTTTTSKKSS